MAFDEVTIHTVRARCGAATLLKVGQSIKIINTSGHQVVDTWCFALPSPELNTTSTKNYAPLYPTSSSISRYSVASNIAASVPEYMSMSHTRSKLAKLTPEKGDTLFSQKRYPMLTITQDASPGVHDTLIAACDRWRYADLGAEGYHENCTDNCWDALAELTTNLESDTHPEVIEGVQAIQVGMGGRVPDPLNLFMNIPIGEGKGANRAATFEAPLTKEGDFVVLRAEKDVVVVMSSCPQDMNAVNGGAPMDSHFQVLL
ncbi:hypothetical protein M501DRAFT_1026227 [Patellaria atrata CBS 101060]|uniref:DUF1989 domain-containing protein n=1 Tax=Patellaria atrata CBS 101060 TaxID=1346257 RepID=A0A9P4VN76_9PEZI|nr:hypothetical protein M501DRAFT_1026227 [Patellaria atrata CBS 101060]